MTSLSECIIDIATEKLECYINKKYTEEEQLEYYASEDYQLHLNYLIETWVSHIKKEFNNYEIKYRNKDFITCLNMEITSHIFIMIYICPPYFLAVCLK
jgi:hypothetical protein